MAKSHKPDNLASKEAQSARFIEAARAAGASEDEAVFDANLKKIAKVKTAAPTHTDQTRTAEEAANGG